MAIETEAKLELQRDAYLELLAFGTIKRETAQLNVYYDCDWALAGKGATFRIRFAKGTRPVCTFKVPVSNERAGLRVAEELEAPLNTAFIRRTASSAPIELFVSYHLADGFRDALRVMGIERLFRVGWMRNRRTVLEIAGLGDIELDQLRLPNGRTVFEAEIENTDRTVIQNLTDYLLRHWPSAQPTAMGKFERFCQALLEAWNSVDATQEPNKLGGSSRCANGITFAEIARLSKQKLETPA